jgi:hypothetical protein
MRRFALLVAVAAALVFAAAASASPYVRYGVQDDAWLEYGPGTLADRLDEVRSLGVDIVRVNVSWRRSEPRPGIYDWSRTDTLLDGLHAHEVAPLVTLYGSPGWANGGRPENWAPRSATSFAAVARRIAARYPYVRLWAIWNEPNQRRWLRPTSPTTYVEKLLNPAYRAIHSVNPRAQVAGGVTAPRGSTGGVSPVDWIRGMAKAHARLDAYAHNPYPLRSGETPTSGGCDHCETITMATLPRLLGHVRQAFGTRTRIWLTEYGYQTNPPDRHLGVSYRAQARYLSEAALRTYQAPRVDVLIHYLVGAGAAGRQGQVPAAPLRRRPLGAVGQRPPHDGARLLPPRRQRRPRHAVPHLDPRGAHLQRDPDRPLAEQRLDAGRVRVARRA